MGVNINPEVMTELVRVGIPLVVSLIERRAGKPILQIPDTELLVMLRDPNLISDTDSAIEEGRARVRAAKLKTETLKQTAATDHATAHQLPEPEKTFVQEVPGKFVSTDDGDNQIMPQDLPE